MCFKGVLNFVEIFFMSKGHCFSKARYHFITVHALTLPSPVIVLITSHLLWQDVCLLQQFISIRWINFAYQNYFKLMHYCNMKAIKHSVAWIQLQHREVDVQQIARGLSLVPTEWNDIWRSIRQTSLSSQPTQHGLVPNGMILDELLLEWDVDLSRDETVKSWNV